MTSLAKKLRPSAGSTTAVIPQPMVTPPPRPAEKLTRGGQSAGKPGQIVSAANRWRENYNPLRELSMRRVVELLELAQRGDTAYLQWTYQFIERRNPTLSGLISRCEAPFASFDWSIKIRSTLPPGATPEMAQRQRRTLSDAYENIDNLRAALLHLHKADFRGYAHLQKHRDPDGNVYHLEPLHQWCVCRDGLEGNWFWNPDSRSTSMPMQFLGLPYCLGGPNLPLDDFIIRECPRPVNEIGLIDTVRRGLCEKDWDGFIEIYGIPGGVVIMPPQVPQGRESDYEQAARGIAEGAAGALPHGSDFKANAGPRGVDPFTPRLAHLDEALVLAGTGGKLAVLTEKSGDSRGNSRVHDKSFGEIANGRARSCAECFIRQFDGEILRRRHPGEPSLVYFDFGAEEEEDLGSLCANVLTLRKAGKDTNAAWLSEKTGYPLTQDHPRPGEPLEPELPNPAPPTVPPAPAPRPTPATR
jgi:phage gp29-like protein